MSLFFLLLVFWIGFVVYLFAEKHSLDKCRRSIPIRIAVNGTRGKTGAVRMTASALRASGIKTCAKTSGSETRFVYPDGSEDVVARSGPPSVIEQVRVLKKAAGLGVEAVVCEIMGVHPEYQILESKKILDPLYTVIVNARLDHPEQGESEMEVMKNYLAAVPKDSRVFCPSSPGENNDRAKIILDLCRSLGLDETSCEKAMRTAEMDRGAFRIYHCGKMDCYNLFAANDVESTRILMDGLEGGFRVGLFNSRRDRPWRDLQFVKALRNGVFDDIRIFFVMGSAGAFFKRKLQGRTRTIKSNDPEKIMALIQKALSEQEDLQSSTVQVIGMGNIKGATALLDYWQVRSASPF